MIKKVSNMILFHDKIIIATLTTHIPINKISKVISKKNFYIIKLLISNTLKIDFNKKKINFIRI